MFSGIRRVFLSLALFFTVLAVPILSYAHFGMIIPSKGFVLNSKDRNVDFTIAFAHPMEQSGMTMQRPVSFIVQSNDAKTDLTQKLTQTNYLGHTAWTAKYAVEKPGVYAFGVQPEPYFEPAEDCFIVHYTKVYVPAFGEEDGWDAALNYPVEIIPLTRPFGNFAGSVFQGRVLVNGKPAPNCTVEVEYLNNGKKRTIPNPYYTTQGVKTDDNGIFTFVAPFAGWWGFAALSTSPTKVPYQGTDKEVEVGGVIWVLFGGSK